MRIAILGTRGIPNHYGGFEQYAEQLSAYLVSEGWEVLVYNSSDHPYKRENYNGVNIRHVYDPERRLGTIGQFIYDLGCIWHSRRQRFDVIYQLGYTSSAVFNFLFPKETVIVTNMDGMEWKRTKYSRWVQRFLRFSEGIVVKSSHHLIADSLGIQSYIRQQYGAEAFYSAYTASIPGSFDAALLEPYGLSPEGYDLLIARMEPENNIEMVILAHLRSASPVPLVVVGATHTSFGQYLSRKYASEKIRFVGAIYEKYLLDNLRHFTRLYFHGHSVGGTNPSLLEAMACQCRVVAHDNQFNRGVLQDHALYFEDDATLASIIDRYTPFCAFFDKAAAGNLVRINTCYSEAAVFSALKEKLAEWGRGGKKR